MGRTPDVAGPAREDTTALQTITVVLWRSAPYIDQLNGNLIPARFMDNHTQQVQCLRVIGFSRQYWPIQ